MRRRYLAGGLRLSCPQGSAGLRLFLQQVKSCICQSQGSRAPALLRPPLLSCPCRLCRSPQRRSLRTLGRRLRAQRVLLRSHPGFLQIASRWAPLFLSRRREERKRRLAQPSLVRYCYFQSVHQITPFVLGIFPSEFLLTLTAWERAFAKPLKIPSHLWWSFPS